MTAPSRSEASRPDLLIIGVGAVGAAVAEFAARSAWLREVICTDRDAALAEGVAWRASLGAMQEGIAGPRLLAERLDVMDVAAVREALHRLRPRAILHTATLLTVREMAQRLGPDLFGRVRGAGLAAWLPVHLIGGVRLADAMAGLEDPPAVITAPFPDFANAVLWKLGLRPVTGIGNVDNVASELRAMVAEATGAAAAELGVMVVAHHTVAESFQRTGTDGGVPWLAHVTLDGRDITRALDLRALLAESSRRMRGVLIEARVASSALRIARAVLARDGRLVHGAGACGRPGGWPLRITATGAEIVLPAGVEDAEALAVNLAGQAAGGIARIEDDGTLYVGAEPAALVAAEFGVDVRVIAPGDVERLALDLRAAFDRKVNRAGG